MRHRRPAQRRQVHPLQRPDQVGHRGGELPLLHHRAQRRHRRSARSAPAQLSAIVKPQKIQPAIVEFVDIAGLVAGASKGEGLGNQFLANIRETDAIVHVVRCFADDNVVHVSGKVDPLPTSRSSTPNWRWPTWRPSKRRSTATARRPAGGDKDAKLLVAVLEKLLPHLNEGQAGARARPFQGRMGSTSSRSA
jgi:ribosome-binding ATPase YchF (GTP1/OBG family)